VGNVSFVVALLFGSTEYKVEAAAPLSEIQNGPIDELEIPQGLINCLSVALVAKGVDKNMSPALAGAGTPVMPSIHPRPKLIIASRRLWRHCRIIRFNSY
jgi:hypothetical protein